ncbi:ARY2 protein, partial [Amia calva]|nr:ARY2 protein [Amia calva]
MDVGEYLRRIDYTGPVEPTLEALQQIHLRHLLSVPFENLTIHSGGKILLERPLIYDKVVKQRRGGFCFEINGIFSWLLSQMGFEVTLLSAQVRNSITGCYGPPFDHLIILVALEGQRWLCDVGFGEGFQLPLSLETHGPLKQGNGVFQLRHQGETIFLETVMKGQGQENGRGQKTEYGHQEELMKEEQQVGWLQLYKFTLQPRHLEEFKAMCHYHQTSPSSLFYCKSLCSLLMPNGRITYIGRKLIITRYSSDGGGDVIKTTMELSDEEIPDTVQEKFGIKLQSPLTPKNEDIIPPPTIY